MRGNAVRCLVVLLVAAGLSSGAARAIAVPGGRIAFVGEVGLNTEIFSMNADGTGQTNLTNDPARDFDPALSPDGTRVAFASDRGSNGWDIWVMNADGTGLRNLASNPALDWTPAWSPDGTRIAFTSYRAGGGELFTMNADGSNLVQVTHNAFYDRNPAWSPDGSTLAFESYRSSDWDIFTIQTDGTGEAAVAGAAGYDFEPTWSPDGTRIAWRTGRWDGIGDIAVTTRGTTAVTNLTNDPAYDREPSWSPDGTRIAYASVTGDAFEIVSMNPDGGGKTNLTRRAGNDYSPSWGGGGVAGTATLTVHRAGTGRGSVRSTPAGIACGRDCSEAYPSGTQVTLRAIVRDGSAFAGWSGACTGSGACTLALSGPVTVTATFTRTG